MSLTRSVIAEIFSILGTIHTQFTVLTLESLVKDQRGQEVGRWPMAYVIAEPCIGVKDIAFVDACPVDCIHPKKNTTYEDGRPGFGEVSQLYIDLVECIDCGACVPVCPVSAIFALDDLPEKWKHFAELNASYLQADKFTPEEFAKHQAAK
jgi:NAD-dependent dihydropyrimidine dehydrogenase PreA subunit